MTCRVALLALISTPLAVACSPDSTPEAANAPSLQAAAVVYGADDRVDWYAFPDPAVRTLTRDAVAAMIDWSSVSLADGNATIASGPTLGQSHSLCADQRFRDQPTPATCSGTLIDAQLLLTAGHCVESMADCAQYAWVFDFAYEAEGQLAPVPADSVFRCVDIIARSAQDFGISADLAVLQLDRPAVGRAPAPVRAPGAVVKGDPLIMAGFPGGIPMKIDDGGLVDAPRADAGDYFVTSVDAFHGHSGSGVFGADLAVVGVLSDGAEDYEDAGSCNIVSVLDPDDADEDVVYAHHAVTAVCALGFPSADLCGTTAECGDDYCTDDENATACPSDCDGVVSVPAAWTCHPGWYGAGDGCDCGCGVYDLDCDVAGQKTFGCAPGGTCQADATCTKPLPEGWSCKADYYDVGDDCDCNCGAYDPDCDDPGLHTVGCLPGGVCKSDGTCTIGVPPSWTCWRRYYAAGDDCDCDCGAYDPDCNDPSLAVLNCSPGSACGADGTCDVPVPSAWVCASQYYGRGDGCDCNCGAYDPDCDGSAQGVLNCADGLTCSSERACIEPGSEPDPDPEPDPEPGPEPGPEPEPEPLPEPGPEPAAEPIESDAGPTDITPPVDTAIQGVSGARSDDDGWSAGGSAPVSAAWWLVLLVAAAILRRRERRSASS